MDAQTTTRSDTNQSTAARPTTAHPTAGQSGSTTRPRDRRHDVHDRVVHNRSVYRRACHGDQRALVAMVDSFLPDGEQVVLCNHTGTFGLLFRMRSFIALTDRRAIAIIAGPFKRLDYSDGLLEHVNSSGISQPSRGSLYLWLTTYWLLVLGTFTALGSAVAATSDGDTTQILTITTLMALAVILLASPALGRVWFRFHKTGIVLHVREGREVTAFVDNRRMPLAMALYREVAVTREQRMATLRLSAG